MASLVGGASAPLWSLFLRDYQWLLLSVQFTGPCVRAAVCIREAEVVADRRGKTAGTKYVSEGWQKEE